jgi:AraC family transcriptional regulator, regulatory protein of adaptative response / methylated-DNA-[protein]-cysteine methyltransferase
MNKTIEIEKLANATRNDPRWLAVVKREKTADGTFYYSVKTTGVYCRPSCASRLARPENVLFHQTPEDAERPDFAHASGANRKGPHS